MDQNHRTKQSHPQGSSKDAGIHQAKRCLDTKATILQTPPRPHKVLKTDNRPSHQDKRSSILGSLFRSHDAIDLTMSDSDSEEDFFHDVAGSDPFDTPGSSVGPRASTSPPAHRPVVSSSKAAFNSKHSPSWILFREDDVRDGSPDRIFLPIPQAARKPKPIIKTEQRESELETSAKLPPSITPINAKDQDESPPSPPPPPPRTSYLSPFNVVDGKLRVKVMQKQKDGRLAVPWGVQWFLASLASLGHISMDEISITKGINALRSESHFDSISALLDPAKQQVLWDSDVDPPAMARAATDRERQVYAELDREARLRATSPLNGVIGPPTEEMRSYGGRVLFEGRYDQVKLEGKKGSHRQFSIKLFSPKLGGSCRFSRRFGSESILRIKLDPAIAKDARKFAVHNKTREIQQEILQFLSRTIQIMGRRYRAFYCKDETVFYFCVGPAGNCHDKAEFDCVWDLIDHHAPFAENSGSSLGKFIQRVQLGLSTSVPASTIDEINQVPDTFGDADPQTGRRVEMTDGAGCVSIAVAQDIARHLGYMTIPAAFQGRVAGAKGVWYLDPAAERALPNEKPKRWIEIRDSQNKIKYAKDKPLDLSQRIVDLLGPSRTFWPSTLSKQIILVLESNGVPISTFADMQRAELQKIANDICNWDGPADTVRMHLSTVVDQLCKVETTRAKRSTDLAEHRAQGMESHVSGGKTNVTQGSSDDDRETFFGQNGRHLWNGMPLSKYERAYEMLIAGFHPESCAYLADLLVEIADMAMRKVIKRFAIPVARSAEAIVIPDPTGTLEEGEIQFRFSDDHVLDPDTGLRLEHVPEGDVLVTRHPCLLPTDVRKVRAVVRPELSLYRDVVVFSTKGQTPLASLLSGGDYDGDLIRVFWEAKLVTPFKNSDVRYADCPFKVEDVFDRCEKTVGEFVAEHEHKHKDERDRELIKHLVAGAFEPAVRGLYGSMHLYAAWQFGTASAEAVELAHKFCQCMDSHKTGLSIKPRVRIQDSKEFMGDLPEWAYDDVEDTDSKDWFSWENYNKVPTARKNAKKPASVLCALWSEGKEEKGLLKARLQKQTEKLRGAEDKDVSGFWNEAVRKGRVPKDVEQALRGHVNVLEQSYERTNACMRQIIEARVREQRNGTTTVSSSKQQSHSVPLRRVRSEAAKPSLVDRLAESSGDSSYTRAVDDLSRKDLLERLDGTIEVPVVLGSTNEVARYFCEWPKALARNHIDKMEPLEVERLAYLRAAYAYSITYHSKRRFAFEMAWQWIIGLKAKATGEKEAPKSGSLMMPMSTLDVMALRSKIIHRNFERSQGTEVEF